MAYNDLTRESGGDDKQRVEEAHRILKILADVDSDGMTAKERDFVNQMQGCFECTTKQLFWLRDIKDKYL
jgi:hypothetical protein